MSYYRVINKIEVFKIAFNKKQENLLNNKAIKFYFPQDKKVIYLFNVFLCVFTNIWIY